MESSLELERLHALGWQPAAPRDADGVFSVDAEVAVDYPTEGCASLGLDGGSGYWFDHRARAVVDALAATTSARAIWDIGAGTGAMAVRLAAAGYDVVSVEPLAAGARAIAHHHCGPVFRATLDELRLPTSSLPVVGLFDVIEHLRDPRPLLDEVRRVLEPNGVVVVTVPAFRVLWSTEDEVARHHRRYTRRTLDGDMIASAFVAARSEYLFASLLAPALALRALPYRLGRRRSAARVHQATAQQLAPSRAVDAVARSILGTEYRLSRHLPLPAGLSVLAVYRPAAGDH